MTYFNKLAEPHILSQLLSVFDITQHYSSLIRNYQESESEMITNVFLESFHEAVQLLFTLLQTGFHLLYDPLLSVLAKPAARLDHLIHVFLLHTSHKRAPVCHCQQRAFTSHTTQLKLFTRSP